MTVKPENGGRIIDNTAYSGLDKPLGHPLGFGGPDRQDGGFDHHSQADRNNLSGREQRKRELGLFKTVGSAVEPGDEGKRTFGQCEAQTAQTNQDSSLVPGAREQFKPSPKVGHFVGGSWISGPRPRQIFSNCVGGGPKPAA